MDHVLKTVGGGKVLTAKKAATSLTGFMVQAMLAGPHKMVRYRGDVGEM